MNCWSSGSKNRKTVMRQEPAELSEPPQPLCPGCPRLVAHMVLQLPAVLGLKRQAISEDGGGNVSIDISVVIYESMSHVRVNKYDI